MISFSVKTGSRTEFTDITSEIQQAVKKNKWENGLLCIYVPHTTAAVTINENADPSVQRDILDQLNKMVPFNGAYHHSEGNSAAHIKASLIGPSVTVIVANSRMALGTWQGVFFCEFDGPRNRQVFVHFVKN